MMKIDISIGELVDKVTILAIKTEKIANPEKLKNVKNEYALLKQKMNDIGIDSQDREFKELKDVNLKLWHIEDKIRIKEANREFDNEFIQLARSVYFENDKRADIKKRINVNYHSEIMEEKEYVDYRKPGRP